MNIYLMASITACIILYIKRGIHLLTFANGANFTCLLEILYF